MHAAPNTSLFGIGGLEMQSIGFSSSIDIAPLSVLGFAEGLKAYPKVVEIADAATDEIISKNPDCVVLIDSWGFMLRVAQRLRKRAPNIRLIKLLGPQVWATRAGRAKTLASTVDHLLAMFQMEVPYYEPYGLKTTVIGNPALSRTRMGNGLKFKDQHGISSDKKVCLVLPGSRPSEIRRVAPTLVRAAEMAKQQSPEIEIVFAPASSVSEQFLGAFPMVREFSKISTNPNQRFDAMAASDFAIACSGTVTSELAVQRTPFLVAYKLGWLTWAIARGFLYKPDYMSILNIAAEREIAPEFFQTKLKPGAIAAVALNMLNDDAARDAQIAAQDAVLNKMGAGSKPVPELAAEAILGELNSK